MSPSRAVAQIAFPLHTSASHIVDSNGARVHLNGVNWYGAESSDFVVAGLQVAPLQSIVQQIKSLGFNVVRLPWSNQMYESNPVVGNYALAANPGLQGENALTIFDQVVSALTNAGIMVILDNHNSDAIWCCSTTDGNSLWYNSGYPQSNWVADWQGIAQRYQSNPLVIGTDLRNEPRGTATWGGSSTTDWHAAAILGGNAVLSVNPNLLVFVEGINYAGDLSGAANLPVQLNVPNKLVYEAHDYGFWYSGLAGYTDWYNKITPKWGYLVTGSNPQPLWVGEFGTCNTANTCVSSSNASDLGYWFNLATTYMRDYGVDWTYWAANGTESTGSGRSYGNAESYGALNALWNGPSLSSLVTRLQGMNLTASPGFNLIANSAAVTISQGGSGTATIAIVPQNGFTGTVNLTCAVTGGTGGATTPPTCFVPSSQSLSSTDAATFNVTIFTSKSASSNAPGVDPFSGFRHVSKDIAFACLLLFCGGLSRKRKACQYLLIVLLATFPLGCGGGVGGGNSTPGTATGSYTVTVTGTATGASSVGTQIPVTVQ